MSLPTTRIGPPGPAGDGEAIELLRSIDARLRALEDDWRRFQPIAEAFSRGGLLGARAAAKTGRRRK